MSRKRRASSASVDVSAGPSSSSSQVASRNQTQNQNKRRKRQESVVEETIEESSTQSVVEYPQLAHPEPLVEEEEEENIANPTPLRQVRFSEAAENNGNGSTSAHLTPHVNKHKKTIHRRITLDPSSLPLTSTPVASQNKKSRASLPPNFSFSQDSPGRIQELQFIPLSQVLQERVKRRLRRSHLSEEINAIHENNKSEIKARIQLQQLRDEIDERDDRVRLLLRELEMQRQLGIDIRDESAQDRQKINDMEAELVILRQEIEEKREQEAALPQVDGADDIDIIDEDMMIINSPMIRSQEFVPYPNISSSQQVATLEAATPSRPSTTRTRSTESVSQLSLPDANVQAEREAFETAIKFWTREASDAKAALQILTIELQSLGFGDGNTSTEAVLGSIRDAFSSVRERLEAALPGEVPADVSNSELIERVADHLESLATNVADQEGALGEADQVQQELAREVDGLLEKLTEAEIRKRELERRWHELDEQTNSDEIFINELEEKLNQITKDHDIVQGMLNAKTSELVTLEKANSEMDVTVDKLGAALNDYRTVEEKLHALIERMEREHLHALADLESVHKNTVDNLEATLNQESAARQAAETDALAKTAVITNLELLVEQDLAGIESLKQQLAELEDEKAAEQGAKEAAEGEAEQKTTFIENLEVQIGNAENNLDNLREELDRLRELNDAQNRQREAAEEELDAREAKIEDLNKKLHEIGTQANQLRQKLFEIQQREKTSVGKLEHEAKDREDQFQEDMAKEISRRQQAENTAANRNVIIMQIEEALRNAESAMKETLADRDDKITELAALNDRLESALKTTTEDLENTITELENLQASSESQINQLLGDVAALQSQVVEQAAAISTLELDANTTAELHATAITDRDNAIANLNHDIFQARNRIEALESETTSLERRVESEAEAMLELHSSKDEEIAALKGTITNKQAEIENLKVRANDVDSAWDKLLKEKDQEIQGLVVSGEASDKMVARLTKLNASLKERLRKFVRDSTATAQSMRDDVQEALNNTASKNDALRDEGMRVLEEAESMDTVSQLVEVGVPSSSSAPKNKTFLQKFKRQSKSKRQYDSGIGVEDEDSLLME